MPDSAPATNGLEDRATDPPPGPLGRAVRWWKTRHRGTTPDHRRTVIDTMFATGGGIRTGRFWALQGFAIVIATMGLSADSAAVVIGAMLVAPLMTPIMAVATSLALGWPRRAVVPLVGVGLAAVGSIGLAWLLHSFIAAPPLTDEILARTSPDLRDLFIALAAGAAGALGTAREDVSSSLPGVAVAVALVPPLATVGVCLQLGRTDLAAGAFLLFATNLVAIVLASIVVLLWCGFVPARLIERGRAAVWGGAAVTVAALVAVGVPLTIRTVEAAEAAEASRAVTEAVISWMAGQPELELIDISVRDGAVRVDVTGPDEPTDVSALTRQVRGVLGEESTTTVRWSVRSTAEDEDADGDDPSPMPEGPEDDRDDLDLVRAIVDAWAAETPGIDVVGVSIGDETVVVDVVGERAPTTVAALAANLERQTGRSIQAEVRFSERIVVGSDPVVDRRSTIAAAVTRALAGEDVVVDGVRFVRDGDGPVTGVVVDLSGPTPPSDPADLADTVRATVEDLDGFVETDDVDVVLRFSVREVLEWDAGGEEPASGVGAGEESP
ncbi:MAG: DUF389 domain-containing protein [Acidimicrobiales bacterium]